MGMAIITLFKYCVFIAFVISSINCAKLNERRILLPYNNGVATNFTLDASDNGCYQWSSSRVDVAIVEPLIDPDLGCSRSAHVSVVSRVPKRQSTIVFATDKASGSVFRCDVEIDVINSIEIVTTTREIVLEDLPERLEVIAKNDKNDTFTSIGGIQFEWSLTPADILRYRSWSTSSYVAPAFVQFWESKDSKGSIILIEGIRTGSAKVKVRIIGDLYQNVEPTEIVLHVIANLGLIPSHDIYLIRGAKIVFRAEMAKQGPRVPLKLPSPQYYLEILDSKTASLDETESVVEALEEGHTSLILRDRNVDVSDGARQPTTDIHVMRPSYLTIHVAPGENFALCELTYYHITLTAHDDWHHRLYPAENLNLKVTFPSRYFHVDFSSPNGTYHIVRTVNSGNCKINAQLIGAGTFTLTSAIEVTQDVTIYPSLKLNPSLILLPWDPIERPTYTVFANAQGATGHYRWMSNNSNIATAHYQQEESSRVTITTRVDGDAVITCQDVHNSVFLSHLRVSVQSITDMEIIPSIVETHISSNIVLPIALYGYEDEERKEIRRVFDDCSKIPLNVEIVEKTRFEYEMDNVPGVGLQSCRSISFTCKSPGNSRVWIKYGNENEIYHLKTTTVIGCFSLLTAVHPEKVAVLALGSSIDLAFEGGPRPWSMNPEGHFARLSSSVSSIVSHSPIIDRYRYNKDLHVFRITCLKYGETSLELSVGNLASSTLPNPASAKSQLTIICAKPASLVIKPKLKIGCPLNAPQDNVFPVEKDKNIDIEVEVRDEFGRTFYNISTFQIDWHIDRTDAILELDHGVREEVNGAKGYRILSRSLQTVKKVPQNVEFIKLRADLKGYNQNEFRDRFVIHQEIELSFVEKSAVESDEVSILNHPLNKINLIVRKGSGHFGIEWSKSDYANISLYQNEKMIRIIPKNIGSGDVSITDLCLNFDGPTKFHVSVVEALEIRVKVFDKLQLGSDVDAFVNVIDNNGEKLNVNSHHFLGLRSISSNRIISIGKMSVFDNFTSLFKVKGEELGYSTITFGSHSNFLNYIESSPITVQVFAPLRMVPSNLTLVIGNHYQVTCVGGPQPQKSAKFLVTDDSTAHVESNGLVTGVKIGKTKLTAHILSVEGHEYSSAEIDVYVVPLKKIKIVSASSQLQVAAKLPLYVMGENEHETPFSFGTCSPPLKITWSVSNADVASFERVFETAGISESDQNDFALRIVGQSPGTVTIKVTVEVTVHEKDSSYHQIVDNKVLTDSMQIRIFPQFAMLLDGSPQNSEIILMSPYSEFPIVSNRIGEAEVEYNLLNASNVHLIRGNGVILKAGKGPEVASLIIRVNEKFGITQNTIYGIVVDSTSYMFVNAAKSFPVKEILEVFPVGAVFDVKIGFYDNSGRRFDAVRSQVRWTVSRNDLITISRGNDNSTLRIRSLKEGKTIVKVFDDENNMFDFISIVTGFILEPSKLTLSIGEVACMRSKFSTPGSWNSDSSTTIDIDNDLGIIVARSVGNAIVGWSSKSGLSTHSEVNVIPPKEFKLDSSELFGITNTMTHTIPISIIGRSSSSGKSCASFENLNMDNFETPFDCHISFEKGSQMKSIWHSDVIFDAVSGQWMCQFIPISNIDSDALNNANVNVTITATLLLRLRDYDSDFPSLQSAVTVPFLPAFQFTPLQVVFTRGERSAVISVSSVPLVLEDVSLISTPEALKIINTEFIGNTKKFTIYLNDYDVVFIDGASHLHLTLTSKLTKQSERVSVQIKWNEMNISHAQQSFNALINEYRISVIIAILLGLLSFLLYYIKTKQQNKQHSVPMDVTSPFKSDITSSPFSGHRVLNYSGSSITSSPSTSTPSNRVGRPLYTVRNT